MKVKKSIKVLFLALISTISVSAFAEPDGTLVVVENLSPLSMNVQVPNTEISAQIFVRGLSHEHYGPYTLEAYKPFNIFDNRPNNGGFGRCIHYIPENTVAVKVKITGEKILPNGKRWIECSVQVIK